MELAHTIEEMKTICTCGRKATCNARKVGGQFVFEGGTGGHRHWKTTSSMSACAPSATSGSAGPFMPASTGRTPDSAAPRRRLCLRRFLLFGPAIFLLPGYFVMIGTKSLCCLLLCVPGLFRRRTHVQPHLPPPISQILRGCRMGGLLAACSAGSSSAVVSPADGSISLTLSWWGDDSRHAAYHEALAAFSRANTPI